MIPESSFGTFNNARGALDGVMMNLAQKPWWGRYFGLWMAVLISAFVAACGGGGGDSTATPTPVVVPASITAQPADQAVVAGASVSASFSVSASGDGISYQWQRSTDAGATWATITGATSATYQVATTDTSLAGSKYRVLVNGTANSVTSSAATLNVSAAPVPASISVDVSSQSVTTGTAAAFSVTATGSSLTYQWQSSTDGGATFANIAGATGPTLSLSNLTPADSGKLFRVVVSGGSSSVTSAVGALNVADPSAQPQITAVPVGVTVTAPDQATFSVTATGTPTPAFLWEKSIDSGLTWVAAGSAATINTAPAALSDDGTLYRVTVSNSTGTTTSDPVRLTVVAATVAPTITTQPVAATVTAPSAAAFTVVATGAPSPTYQWQVSSDAGANFTNIIGATSATFTTPASSASDNGKKYRVVVTNGKGSVTSAAAVLAVNTVVAASGLNGRAWATGQLVDGWNGTRVSEFHSDIDDAGVVTLIFRKSNGTRTALYASRGTPGAAGVAPSWTTPAVIDVDGVDTYTVGTGIDYSGDARSSITSAPNGDAYAVWTISKACTASTYRTTGTCTYLVLAHYSAALAKWEAPVVITDTYNKFAPVVKVNALGDFAMLFSGWQRPTTGILYQDAIAWRKHGATAFSQQTFPLGADDMAIDASGNMALLGEAVQNSTTDFVAYRGNVTNGFGAQEVIDTRLSAAKFEVDVAMGTGGQIFAFYSQNDGTGTRFYSVTAPSISASFTVTDLNSVQPSYSGATSSVVALDSGDALLRVNCTVRRWSASTGTWSGASNIPDNCGSQLVDVSPQGNTLRLVGSNGRWATYDASTNAMVQSIPSSTSGLPTTGTAFIYGASASIAQGSYKGYSFNLSKSGIGSIVVLTTRDVLPTAALPAGDGRSEVYNLWGLFLK